ncbi:MAG: Peptide deformylase [Candidatus Omnitrophica bacterium]|nr:Peptide deformylase [Candidatus Omnitrophota bacterium]
MSECSGPDCTHSSHAVAPTPETKVLRIEGKQGDIIQYGPPANTQVLRMTSVDTTLEEVLAIDLPARMEAAMRRAWTPACGIAAIQIGVGLRFAIYYRDWEKKASNAPVFLLNPRIVGRSKEVFSCPNEGCLSIAGHKHSTWRHAAVNYTHVVDGQVREDMAFGVEAQIIQHEVDHMDGILVLERLKKPQEPGRNDPCSCGSGKKFKKCCGGAA